MPDNRRKLDIESYFGILWRPARRRYVEGIDAGKRTKRKVGFRVEEVNRVRNSFVVVEREAFETLVEETGREFELKKANGVTIAKHLSVGIDVRTLIEPEEKPDTDTEVTEETEEPETTEAAEKEAAAEEQATTEEKPKAKPKAKRKAPAKKKGGSKKGKTTKKKAAKK